MLRYTVLAGAALLTLAACSQPEEVSATSEPETVADLAPDPNAWPYHAPTDAAITEADFAYRIATLADDRFEGRAPASDAGEAAAQWIADEMAAVGLEPAGEDASWFQPVPLIESTLDESASSLDISINGTPMGLQINEDIVYWSQNPETDVSLSESDLVFVGYGVVAPEYGWDDYAGVDVTGKTVVILVNDPGFAAPDAGWFNGASMTYYGRWTYKYEEAARQGAEGAIIVHQTVPASYPWGTVQASWTGPQFTLASSADQQRADVQAWISEAQAIELFSAVGLDFAELADAAISPDFAPVEMTGAQMTASLHNDLRTLSSNNVAGLVEGAERPDEFVLFMAHWDHIGIRLNFAGDDQIYNGAVDNATGIAAMLELAEAYAKGEQPDRSVIFVAVTAEESGLLGSEYYAQNPLIALDQTVAGFNFDGILPIGPTEDIVVIGYGASELEDILQTHAAERGMYLSPDPNPEAGYFYRSDHVTLARRGVPMMYADSGSIHAELGADYGAQIEAAYRLQAYHKPADEFDANWDLRGFVQATDLMFDVSSEVANSETWPNWYEGNEFRAIRDAMMDPQE